jgi:hypothetical protein
VPPVLIAVPIGATIGATLWSIYAGESRREGAASTTGRGIAIVVASGLVGAAVVAFGRGGARHGVQLQPRWRQSEIGTAPAGKLTHLVHNRNGIYQRAHPHHATRPLPVKNPVVTRTNVLPFHGAWRYVSPTRHRMGQKPKKGEER